MSRVHDALRRAEQMLDGTLDPPSAEGDGRSLVVKDEVGVAEADPAAELTIEEARAAERG